MGGDASSVIVQTVRGDTQPYLGTGSQRAVAQHFVQGATPDADIRRVVFNDARRRNGGHMLPGRGEHLDGLEAKAGTHVVFEQPQLRHGADHIRLLQDADAVHRPIRVFFDDFDVEALLAQGDGGGQPADSPTDDEYGRSLHGPSRRRVARFRRLR